MLVVVEVVEVADLELLGRNKGYVVGAVGSCALDRERMVGTTARRVVLVVRHNIDGPGGAGMHTGELGTWMVEG